MRPSGDRPRDLLEGSFRSLPDEGRGLEDDEDEVPIRPRGGRGRSGAGNRTLFRSRLGWCAVRRMPLPEWPLEWLERLPPLEWLPTLRPLSTSSSSISGCNDRGAGVEREDARRRRLLSPSTGASTAVSAPCTKEKTRA